VRPDHGARALGPRTILFSLGGVLAVLAAVAGSSRPPRASLNAAALAGEIERESDHVTALELAQWIRDRKPGLRVLDVRSDSEYAAYHIPSAERVPLSALAALHPTEGQTLVLYSEGGAHAAQGWVLLRAAGVDSVYFLRGGLLDWMDDVMNPIVGTDSASARTASLSRYFGGTPRAGGDAVNAGAKTTTTVQLDRDATSAVARIRRRGC
jgi:rhodanese-related sulfurtransferase